MADEDDERATDHVHEIILVRHGESAHNIADKAGPFIATTKAIMTMDWQPDHKIPLTEAGRFQATLVGQLLKKHHPAAIDSDIFFDSGYQRAVDTLNTILEQWQIDPKVGTKRRHHLDLREREPGYTFSMSSTQVNQFFPWYEEYATIVGKFYERRPGGESIADVCSRVHMFLNSLRRARQGQRVFIVTHGRVILAFRYWLEKHSAQEATDMVTKDEENCAVRIYRRNPGVGGFNELATGAAIGEEFEIRMKEWLAKKVRQS